MTMSTSPPMDPIAAVTHPDPYAYYAQVVAERPLHRDERLGCWVAAGAAQVSATLDSRICAVRPGARAVPAPLLGSRAATILRRLARVNDGEPHLRARQAAQAVLRALQARPVEEVCGTAARMLLPAGAPAPGRTWQDFTFDLPVHALASLVGVPAENLEDVARWTRDFAVCLAPACTPRQIEDASLAAGRLLELLRSLVACGAGQGDTTELPGLVPQLDRGEADDMDLALANTIGLFVQARDATAGLIANTVVALAARPEVRRRVDDAPRLLDQVLAEVLRYDPPVHNTRRFVVADGVVAGQPMRAGDTILVVVAAANRDPAANPAPAEFRAERPDRRIFTLGLGVHACPGDQLAVGIARAGVAHLMASGADLYRLANGAVYRPSANTRIALLGSGAGHPAA